MRIAFAFLLVLHGVIHLLGFVKGFGLAEIAALELPSSRLEGAFWLLAAAGFVVWAVMLFVAPSKWWLVGAPVLLISQALIVLVWGDAKFGTIPNVIALVPLVVAMVQASPMGFHSRYRKATAEHLAQLSGPPRLVTEAELEPLPPLVRTYLRRSGIVGKPHVEGFRARFHGRFRRDVGASWMDFTSEQHDFVAPSARLFFMEASLAGVPLEGLHVFAGSEARMQVRAASIFDVVDGRGPEMNQGETVTIFNDLCVMAPAALLDVPVRWTTLDERSVRGELRRGDQTISAVLTFDQEGDLVDFVSGDRFLSTDGKTFRRLPWSTPMSDRRDFGGVRLPRRGLVTWKLPEGDFVYGEFLLDEIEYFPALLAPRSVERRSSEQASVARSA